jgi:superfamily I DNA/RNA helicase
MRTSGFPCGRTERSGPNRAGAAARDPKEERIADAYALYGGTAATPQPRGFRRPHSSSAAHAREGQGRRAQARAGALALLDGGRVPGQRRHRSVPLDEASCGAEAESLRYVGDDDQSIYGWRGARPTASSSSRADCPGAQGGRARTKLPLDHDDPLGGQSRHRAERHASRKKLWSSLGQGAPITLFVAPDDREEPTGSAATWRELVAEGHAPKDIAILFRANRQCRPLEQALRTRSIPYRVLGTFSFFDRREVRDLLAYTARL